MTYKHGYAGTPVWNSWKAMKNRCGRLPVYQNIKVCDRWQLFTNFLADMGEPPYPRAAIGRKDHSKDYEPSNCQWEPWSLGYSLADISKANGGNNEKRIS